MSALVPPHLGRHENVAGAARTEQCPPREHFGGPGSRYSGGAKEYADRFGALPDRWWFLTGPRTKTYDSIRNRFKLAVAESTGADRAEGAESIAHSDRLALVDHGRVIGFFRNARREFARSTGCPGHPARPPSMGPGSTDLSMRA